MSGRNRNENHVANRATPSRPRSGHPSTGRNLSQALTAAHSTDFLSNRLAPYAEGTVRASPVRSGELQLGHGGLAARDHCSHQTISVCTTVIHVHYYKTKRFRQFLWHTLEQPCHKQSHSRPPVLQCWRAAPVPPSGSRCFLSSHWSLHQQVISQPRRCLSTVHLPGASTSPVGSPRQRQCAFTLCSRFC